jgi:hypothetical protein
LPMFQSNGRIARVQRWTGVGWSRRTSATSATQPSESSARQSAGGSARRRKRAQAAPAKLVVSVLSASLSVQPARRSGTIDHRTTRCLSASQVCLLRCCPATTVELRSLSFTVLSQVKFLEQHPALRKNKRTFKMEASACAHRLGLPAAERADRPLCALVRAGISTR